MLSFGTAGCNLGCKFCQNWDISKSRETDTLANSASPQTIARAAQSLGCRSVAYTYNDPVIFMKYAIDVALACREVGVKSVAVTAGEICPEPRAEFYRHMDAANVDLKAFTERFYHEICGSHLQPVLETLGSDVPMHFTAFHPDFRMLDKPRTPVATLQQARRIAIANGVKYAYTGNVHDREGGSTYCHECGQMLIDRRGYTLGVWNMTGDGICNACDARCAGIFDDLPGVGMPNGNRFA